MSGSMLFEYLNQTPTTSTADNVLFVANADNTTQMLVTGSDNSITSLYSNTPSPTVSVYMTTDTSTTIYFSDVGVDSNFQDATLNISIYHKLSTDTVWTLDNTYTYSPISIYVLNNLVANTSYDIKAIVTSNLDSAYSATSPVTTFVTLMTIAPANYTFDFVGSTINNSDIVINSSATLTNASVNATADGAVAETVEMASQVTPGAFASADACATIKPKPYSVFNTSSGLNLTLGLENGLLAVNDTVHTFENGSTYTYTVQSLTSTATSMTLVLDKPLTALPTYSVRGGQKIKMYISPTPLQPVTVTVGNDATYGNSYSNPNFITTDTPTTIPQPTIVTYDCSKFAGTTNQGYWSSVVQVKDKIYIFNFNVNTATNLTTYLETQINPDGTLAPLTDSTLTLPSTSSGSMPIVTNTRVYLIGGYDSSSSTTVSSNNVYYSVYDSNGVLGAWVPDTSLPLGVQATAMVSTKSYVYILGGYDASLNQISATNTPQNYFYKAPINPDGSLGVWTQYTDPLLLSYYNELTSLYPNNQVIVTDTMVYIPYQNVVNSGGTVNTWHDLYAPINPDGTLGAWVDKTITVNATTPNTSTVALFVYTKNLVLMFGDGTTDVYVLTTNSDGTINYTGVDLTAASTLVSLGVGYPIMPIVTPYYIYNLYGTTATNSAETFAFNGWPLSSTKPAFTVETDYTDTGIQNADLLDGNLYLCSNVLTAAGNYTSTLVDLNNGDQLVELSGKLYI